MMLLSPIWKSKLSSPLLLRRVLGESMLPGLGNGLVVLAWKKSRYPRPGDVVILRHNGLEKIKRVKEVQAERVYVLGDNPDASTDSRHFGWIERGNIVAKVVWPRVHQPRKVS